jgi:hypothetical protein
MIRLPKKPVPICAGCRGDGVIPQRRPAFAGRRKIFCRNPKPVRGNPSRSDAASAAIAKMPKQGSKRPWRLYQNYALDIVTLRYDKVDAGVMQYS